MEIDENSHHANDYKVIGGKPKVIQKKEMIKKGGHKRHPTQVINEKKSTGIKIDKNTG
jgi:hypothetical protein